MLVSLHNVMEYSQGMCYVKKNKVYKTQSLNNYNTSKKEDLYVQTFNTAHCKQTVVNMGTKLYNRLPVGIKSTDSFKDFKNKLTTFLLENSFYSAQEIFANVDSEFRK
jgi:hypothetical protein